MPMGLLCDSGPAPLAFESHLHLHVRTTLWKLEADGSGPQLDAVGLACNPLGSLWALYADRSLSYFSEPLASRDACWTLPGAVSDLRSAQGLPGHVLTKVLCLRHKKKSWKVFSNFLLTLQGVTNRTLAILTHLLATKVVTHSPSCIQLWSSQLQGDLRLEAQSEPAHEPLQRWNDIIQCHILLSSRTMLPQKRPSTINFSSHGFMI